MEFVATIFTSAAASGGTAAAAGTLSTMELIAGGLSAFGTLAAANMQAESLKAQGQQEQVQAELEEIRGKEQANETRERLLRTLAQNRAAAGASGIMVGSGSVRSGQEQAQAAANRQLSLDRSDTELQAASRRRNARLLNKQAGSARMAGLFRAGGQLAGTAARRARRGSVPNG